MCSALPGRGFEGYRARVRIHRYVIGAVLAAFGALFAIACGAPGGASGGPAGPQNAGSARPAAASASATASVAASVPPKPGRGLLTVRTHPPGALVIIEGVLMGQTPVERVDVEAGPHQMIIAMPGYEAIGTSVTVGAGEHLVHEVTLSQAGPDAQPGPPGSYDDPHCPYASQSCASDCFREHFHCETDCGSCSDCTSYAVDDPMACMVCQSCKIGCKQLQKSCERACERLCP